MEWTSSQPVEGPGQLLVAVVDATYGATSDQDWEAARGEFRCSLEREFCQIFEDGDIGPGASLPAFITLLETNAIVPGWLLIVAAFFLGEPLNKNLKAWAEMAAKVRRFFKRPTYLGRQGAAVLAVDTVFDAMGGLPKSIRLIGYRTLHIGEPEHSLPAPTDIAEAPDTLYLGYVRHVFELEADGRRFRVIVEGREAKIISQERQPSP